MPPPSQVSKVLEALHLALPEYMVPSALVPLPQLPHLPNGKVSRHNLPEPNWGSAETEVSVAAQNQLEVWVQTLVQVGQGGPVHECARGACLGACISEVAALANFCHAANWALRRCSAARTP